MNRSSRSTTLLSISMRPSSRKRERLPSVRACSGDRLRELGLVTDQAALLTQPWSSAA